MYTPVPTWILNEDWACIGHGLVKHWSTGKAAVGESVLGSRFDEGLVWLWDKVWVIMNSELIIGQSQLADANQ
ncbi:hypothetical protein M3O96_14200 [Aquiflexum sp. TKW24L]|uniref:hypothetical protein n=1 Tax=Aquiflexum sp. TKW24L TaxID=2942212 RepID=UPI0020C05F46|nr:hypothetical protein [Aquiflexum sp. TKW24L]MCL6260249.1 hypothetical protein [Aquiflexum sp. TKW24L]